MSKNLYFSIGNTNTYYIEEENGNLFNKKNLNKKNLKNIEYEDYNYIYYISVNNERTKEIKNLFPNIIELKKEKNIFNSLYNIDNMGIDRFICIYYIVNKKEYPALIIDSGTCDTIDFINEEGVHLGGYILPGLMSLSKAVNTFTDELPLVDPDFSTNIPINTEQAIGYGVYFQWLSGIMYFINFANSIIPNSKIIITGGNANKIKDIIKDVEIDDLLIFKGMVEYAKIYSKK